MADIKQIKVDNTNYNIDALKLNGNEGSSAGNAAASTVLLRNAAGSIQSEKLAVSSGTTTKATMQYNSTDDCIEFVFA